MAFGAALYGGNTLLYTNVIFGWPKQKLEADAAKETVKPRAEAPRPDRQPAEIAESQSTAQTTVEPQPAPTQPQGKHAPGLDIAAGAPPPDSAATAPLPPMPQDQRAPESSAPQQAQSMPQAEQAMSAPEEPATEPQQPSGGEWVRSGWRHCAVGTVFLRITARDSQIRHGGEGRRPSVRLGADRQF